MTVVKSSVAFTCNGAFFSARKLLAQFLSLKWGSAPNPAVAAGMNPASTSSASPVGSGEAALFLEKTEQMFAFCLCVMYNQISSRIKRRPSHRRGANFS